MSQAALWAAAGIVDTETRLDYEARMDDQPVFIGRAAAGTVTSGVWVIERLSYDDEDRPERKQTLKGAWDDRAALDWS